MDTEVRIRRNNATLYNINSNVTQNLSDQRKNTQVFESDQKLNDSFLYFTGTLKDGTKKRI